MSKNAPLRAVTDDERRCPAIRLLWPRIECELPAGHEGAHKARDPGYRQRVITWRTGKETEVL